jgi:stage V sporulation protein G
MKDIQQSPTQATPVFTMIRIQLIEKDNLRALASVKVADAVYLTGLRVITGKNGLFLAMSNRKTGAGEYQDIYFPASKAMRDDLQSAVLEAYDAEVKAAGQGSQSAA